MSSILLNPSSSSPLDESYHHDPTATIDPARLTASQTSTTPDDFSNFLSPFSHTQSYYSNPGSPSYRSRHTPTDLTDNGGYSISDFSDFGGDDFLGVNFDADAQPDTADTSAPSDEQSPLSSSTFASNPGAIAKPPMTGSSYPISPIHTATTSPTVPNMNNNTGTSPNSTAFPALDLHFHHPYPPMLDTGLGPESASATERASLSQSNLEAAELLQPFPHATSPRVLVSHWGEDDDGNSVDHASYGEAIERDNSGAWISQNRTGQGGVAPDERRLSVPAMPTLKEQEQQRQIDAKNDSVAQWRTRSATTSVADEQSQSYFSFSVGEAGRPRAMSTGAAFNDGSLFSHQSKSHGLGLELLAPDIIPVEKPEDVYNPPNDGWEEKFLSETENRLVEGQIYFNPSATPPEPIDKERPDHFVQARHWTSPPAMPHITKTKMQPETANEAIARWNADNFSQLSRAATWGTRRKSEPSIYDAHKVTSGNLFKLLSISKNKEKDKGEGFRIFRKKSDNKLKRGYEPQPRQDSWSSVDTARKSSTYSLLQPSFTRKPPTPSLNTAIAAIAGSAAAVGSSHARSGSMSAATSVSPKSPIGFAKSVMRRRTRSRSDLPRQPMQDNVGLGNIAEMWKSQGGPPVPTLSSPPIEPSTNQEHADDEDEEDEEEEQDHASLYDSKPDEHVVINPTRDGFRAHVRQLNPDISQTYLLERCAHHNRLRYKALLTADVQHHQKVRSGTCAADSYCLRSVGRNLGRGFGSNSSTSLQVPARDGSEDESNPDEGMVTSDSFPPGIPMPPVQRLPATFECQLCYRVKLFQKPSDWTKHVHEDLQPFTCTFQDCKDSKFFKRKADWVRHENERHRHLEWWTCQVDDCNHECFRKDNFLQHLVREHKLPEPKYKTKAAIKRSQGDEDKVWVLLAQCHHDTPRTPQEEPCKFCGQVSTTWKKHTVHLAKHLEQLSMPILRLVEQRTVDEDTIISPVEPLRPPVLTPVRMTKQESTHSASFSSSDISPSVPTTQNAFGPYEANNMYSLEPQPNPLEYNERRSMQRHSMPINTQYVLPSQYTQAYPAMTQPRLQGFSGSSNDFTTHVPQHFPQFPIQSAPMPSNQTSYPTAESSMASFSGQPMMGQYNFNQVSNVNPTNYPTIPVSGDEIDARVSMYPQQPPNTYPYHG
jgi:hypothetical protein